MVRFGFGEKTGETEKGGLDQFENGHVEVSGTALKYAIEQYPNEPPKQAVGRLLVGDASGADDEAGENEVDDE